MAAQTGQAPAMAKKALERLLRPRSVAIVGASTNPDALGASVLRNLERAGFQGDIHLINPKRPIIGARACVGSVEELPDGIDVAVLAIPRGAVIATLQALALKKAGSAIIFSSGFAEGGEEGLAQQREIIRIAAESGMAIEGPNCLGLVNHMQAATLTFVESPVTPAKNGRGVAIVSQSGAMAAVLGVTLSSRDIGLSYSISTGNEAVTGVEDYVEHLIEDADTRVFAMIVEHFRKPKRFLDAAKRAQAAGKSVVLLHPGKSAAARDSAATHTGAMAGDFETMRVMVERAGVILVDSMEELGDVAEILSRCHVPPLPGTAVLGESGAFKALTLDLCEAIGLDLPHLDDDNAPDLREAMPDFVPVSNPTDLTAQGLVDPDMYRRVLAGLLKDERFGAVLFAIIQTDEATAGKKFPSIINAIETLKPQRAVIFAGLDEGAPVSPSYIAQLRARGCPYFPTADRALRALAHIAARAKRVISEAGPENQIALALPKEGGVIPEYRAKTLLAPLGVPFPKGRIAASPDEGCQVAAEIGYPVVLKAQAAALSHKSDAGGVILNVAGDDALRKAWAQMRANIENYAPGMKLDGILIEGMGQRGLELIVGGRNDPDWGPVILVGFGGVQAEINKDFKLLPPGLSQDEILAALDQLKGAPLLRGFRGSPALDVAAVAKIIASVGGALASNPNIAEIDLNPVVVHPKGEGAIALDALMLTTAR